MKRLCVSLAALVASTGAYAADLPTKKAPVVPEKPNCFSSLYTYFNSTPADCPLTYWGLTFYATIDIGGGWESHSVPFNNTQHTGVEELLQKNSNKARWLLTPNGLSQSQVGVKIKEPLYGGVSFVGEFGTGFDPYSLRLANGPGAQIQNNLLPLPLQSANADSSRAGQFDNSVGYAGFSHDVYGALTVGRQNSLSLDGINAYDPMGGSYAFSLIGWSGKTAGAGQTETARINTSVKYAVKLPYDLHAAAIVQFGGYDLYNGSNGEYQIDFGGDFFNKSLSLDAIYSKVKDQVSLSTYNGPVPAGVPTNALKATLDNAETVILLAKYKWNQFTVYGGWEHDYFTNPSDTSFPNGFTNIEGGPVVASGITTTPYGNATTRPLNFDVYWTGAKYAFNDQVDITGAYYLYVQNDYNVGATAATCAPNTAVVAAGYAPLGTASSKCKGYENAFSVMVDYHPLKRVDLYAGVFYSKVTGGLATGYLEPDNIAPTAGIRVRF